MAVHRPVLGVAEVEHVSYLRLNQESSKAVDMPGGLYPMMARAYEMEEYRTMAGWPVSIPKCDIHANTLVSAEGEVFTDRDDATAITTGALLRWTADPDLYDATTLKWHPVQNFTGSQTYWETSVEYAPVYVADYEYRVGDERFYRGALNFDSDSRNHMWADFSSTIGGASGFTIIMVLSPNSTYGNNLDVPYNGLWAPGGATPPGDTFVEETGDNWFQLSTQGSYLWLETESGRRMRGTSIAPQLSNSAPMIMAIVFERPNTHMYVGNGPSQMRRKSLTVGSTPVPLSNSYVLGRSTGDVLHTADMALFDIGVYADSLGPVEIADEFALLAQTYGGDS